MPRRRMHRRHCTTTGCRAYSDTEYGTQTELRSIPTTWTCKEHGEPDKYLTPANRETTAVLTLHPSYIDGYMPTDPPKLVGYFWGPEDAEKGSHGIVSGPGFWAEAKEFPPGTRLIVTTRIELPTTPDEG